MKLRLLPALVLGALFLGAPALAPVPAHAAGPIDLESDDDEEEDEDESLEDLDDLDLLGEDLVRGGPRVTDKDFLEEPDDIDPFDMDFDEPVEEFEEFEGIPEDEPFEGEALPDFEALGDEPVEDFDRPARRPSRSRSHAAKGPGPIEIDVAGRQPMTDNYPLEVVAVDRDAVVVELPVLVARSRVEVDEGFLVYGEVFVGDSRVAEVRQVVERDSVAEFGPTFAFLKVLAPVVERQGEVKVVVSKADLDGANRTELFSRVTPYALN